MSANSSEPRAPRLDPALMRALALVSVALLVVALAGCVSSADQVTSEAEAERFRLLVDDADARRPDPERFRARAEAMIERPLSFWGRVIDDTGAPVPSAQIRVFAFDRLLDPFVFPYFTRTTRPELEVSRAGHFSIRRVRAAGLYLEAFAPGHVAGAGASRLYFPDDPAMADGGSRQARILFRLRRAAAGETLEPVHSGARLLPQSGETLAVNVRGFDPLTPAPGTGDVEIRCDRPEGPDRPRPFSWTCTFAVPGGGVQPQRLAFDQAPASGYAPAYTLSMRTDDGVWQPRASRDLLLRFPDGTFGRYTFSVRLEGRDYVAIDGVWNPSGNRAFR